MSEELIIRVFGTSWCGDCFRSKKILNSLNVPYLWIDISQDKKAEEFVKSANNGLRRVPTLIFPDGSMLVEPSDQVLTKKINSYLDVYPKD